MENIPFCNSCALSNICGGPCLGELYSEKGTILERSPYRESYEEVIRFAFQLIAQGELPNLIKIGDYEFRYNTT